MKKIITHDRCANNKKEKVVAPSAQTLDFLKQFARTYFVEKELSGSVNGICMN